MAAIGSGRACAAEKVDPSPHESHFAQLARMIQSRRHTAPRRWWWVARHGGAFVATVLRRAGRGGARRTGRLHGASPPALTGAHSPAHHDTAPPRMANNPDMVIPCQLAGQGWGMVNHAEATRRRAPRVCTNILAGLANLLASTYEQACLLPRASPPPPFGRLSPAVTVRRGSTGVLARPPTRRYAGDVTGATDPERLDQS